MMGCVSPRDGLWDVNDGCGSQRSGLWDVNDGMWVTENEDYGM